MRGDGVRFQVEPGMHVPVLDKEVSQVEIAEGCDKGRFSEIFLLDGQSREFA